MTAVGLIAGTLAAIVGALGARAAGAEHAGVPADTTQVVLLGTGNPNPDPDRSGPAVAVVVDGQPYIVDCGPGVVRRAEAARRNGGAALESARLDIVFLTHLPSDHTLGCPDLLLSPWVIERSEPLRVFGPP